MTTARISREDSKARTRAELVAAAQRVFLRRGFHAARPRRDRRGGRLHEGRRLLELLGEGRPLPGAARRALRARARRCTRRSSPRGRRDAEETFAPVARVMARRLRGRARVVAAPVEFSTHAVAQPGLSEQMRAAPRGSSTPWRRRRGARARHGSISALPAREAARGTGALMRGMAMEWAIDPEPADRAAFEEMLAAFLRGLAAPRRGAPHDPERATRRTYPAAIRDRVGSCSQSTPGPRPARRPQSERLRDLLAHAASPRPTTAKCSAPTRRGTELDELPTLPKATLMDQFDRIVTDPALRVDDLRAFLAGRIRRRPSRGSYRVFATSGSTGEPGLFVFSHAEFAHWIAVGLARLSACRRRTRHASGRDRRARRATSRGSSSRPSSPGARACRSSA